MHGKEEMHQRGVLVGAVCAIVWYLHIPVVLDSYLLLMANRCKEPVNFKDFSSIKYRAKCGRL